MTRTLWMQAAIGDVEVVAPGEFTDDNGSTNESVALLIGTDFTTVIEGTVSELREYLTMVLRTLARYEDTH